MRGIAGAAAVGDLKLANFGITRFGACVLVSQAHP